MRYSSVEYEHKYDHLWLEYKYKYKYLLRVLELVLVTKTQVDRVPVATVQGLKYRVLWQKIWSANYKKYDFKKP